MLGSSGLFTLPTYWHATGVVVMEGSRPPVVAALMIARCMAEVLLVGTVSTHITGLPPAPPAPPPAPPVA
jgi:hypothetical protein